MIADDLFAGAGGWDLAAEALGITARGIENMPAARATRDAAGLVTIHDDVWTYQPDGLAEGEVASAPCPTFSPAGKGTGRRALSKVLQLVPLVPHMTLEQLRAAKDLMDGDERTALVLTPLWFLTHYPSYRWAAWEQVPTVLPVWEACANVLRGFGWNVWTGKVYAEQYGVPQARIRAKLLASLDREVGAPVPTHSLYHRRNPTRLDEGVLPWVSMADGIGYGLTDRPSPTITGGGTATGGAEPIVKIASRWATKPTWIPRPAIDGETVADCEWVYGRPSPTIVGTYRPDVVAKPGYRKAGDPPRQKTPGSVRITVEEAGRLQGFPGNFPWQGNEGQQYLQAGNAVPPPMALRGLAVASGIAIPTRAINTTGDAA